MKQSLTRFRDTIIHDFDGAQYEIKKLGDDGRFFAKVKAEITEEYFPEISFEERLEIGDRSYNLTGDPLHIFTQMASERGHDPVQFHEELHDKFHRAAFQKVTDQGLSIFKPCPETNREFEYTTGRIRHGMLTQGCVDTWAKPAMEAMQRAKFFEPDCFVGPKDFGNISKGQSTIPMEIMMKRMGADPSRTIFLDDSLKCLEQAKLYNEDICTVHIASPASTKKEKKFPGYVDIRIRSVGSLLRLIDTLHPSPKSHRSKSGQPTCHL